MKYFFSIVFIILIFSGCYTKQPLKTQSVLVVLKTPDMKYSDMGFIKTFKDRCELEIYNFGQAILFLKVYENKICTSDLACTSAQSFNNEHFSKAYPSSFFYEVLQGKELSNMNGIEYTYTTDNGIYFKDSKNNILIKIKEQL